MDLGLNKGSIQSPFKYSGAMNNKSKVRDGLGLIPPTITTSEDVGAMSFDERDPKRINSHLELVWENVIGEPRGLHQSPQFMWTALEILFRNVHGITYKVLTVIIAPFFVLFSALVFALTTFLQIWLFRPLLRLIELFAVPVRTGLELFLGATIAPLCAAFSTCFSHIRIKHQRIHDAKEESPFPFIV